MAVTLGASAIEHVCIVNYIYEDGSDRDTGEGSCDSAYILAAGSLLGGSPVEQIINRMTFCKIIALEAPAIAKGTPSAEMLYKLYGITGIKSRALPLPVV